MKKTLILAITLFIVGCTLVNVSLQTTVGDDDTMTSIEQDEESFKLK